MLSVQRVLHGATDISVAVNDFRAGVYTFAYTTGGYLYVASEVPFNNLWIDVAPVNAVAATVAVQVWWGNSWHSVVDVIDQTASAAGAALAASGRLAWALDRQKGWDYVSDPALYSEHGLTVPVYDMFWARLAWSANLTASTGLKYIGQKFNSDSELTSYYPDLANTSLMAAFASGKADWNEQAYMAAEQIIRDLTSRKVIRSRGQVFDWSRFTEASCHKVAEIVYRGLGSAYADSRKDAGVAYAAAMNKDFFRVDMDADGRLDDVEKRTSQTFMTR